MCYTGFTFENLVGQKDESRLKLLSLVDMLIDGPYIEEQKDISLTFRGSRNQRIIDVKSSLNEHRIVQERLYKEVS